MQLLETASVLASHTSWKELSVLYGQVAEDSRLLEENLRSMRADVDSEKSYLRRYPVTVMMIVMLRIVQCFAVFLVFGENMDL